MTRNDFVHAYDWRGPTFDPNDEHFGDVVENVDLSEAEDYEAVLVGEPYDGGQVSVRGAALGPEGLRQAFAETKTGTLTHGPVTGVGDLGDVDVPWGEDVVETQTYLKRVTKTVHERDVTPVFMGGGHDLGYPNSAPLLDLHDSVAIVNFDAHADVREVVDKPYNGSPFRQVIEEGLDDYAFVGGRHHETSTAYVEFMRDRDFEIVPSEAVGADPVGSVERALESIGDVDAIHVSCDLDVLDMTAAPGTTAPTPGGLATRELYTCLRTIAGDPRVTSLDVIGCAPPLETGTQRLMSANVGRTAIAGARAIANFLAGKQYA